MGVGGQWPGRLEMGSLGSLRCLKWKGRPAAGLSYVWSRVRSCSRRGSSHASNVGRPCTCFLRRSDSATPLCLNPGGRQACAEVMSPISGLGASSQWSYGHLAWLRTRACHALAKAWAKEKITCCGRALWAQGPRPRPHPPLQARAARALDQASTPKDAPHVTPLSLLSESTASPWARHAGSRPRRPSTSLRFIGALRLAPTPKRCARKGGTHDGHGVWRNVSGRSQLVPANLKLGEVHTKPLTMSDVHIWSELQSFRRRARDSRDSKGTRTSGSVKASCADPAWDMGDNFPRARHSQARPHAWKSC